MSALRRIAIVMSFVAAGVALGAPSAALAGNNGQQIRLCTSYPRLAYGKAFITGNNQSGKWTVSPYVQLGDSSGGNYASPGGCTEFWGWWWIGDVTIYWFEPSGWDPNGVFYRKSTCNIPQWNPFTNIRRCDA
jgi:hypothetical protein